MAASGTAAAACPVTEDETAPLASSAAFTLGDGQALLFATLGSKLQLSLGCAIAAAITVGGTLGGVAVAIAVAVAEVLAVFVEVATSGEGTALLVLVFVAGLVESIRSRLRSSSTMDGQPVCSSSMRFGLMACMSSATGKAPDGSSSSIASASASASEWAKSGWRSEECWRGGG